jgi:hypothetical protein
MKFYFIAILYTLLAACAPIQSNSTYQQETKLTWLRPDTTPNEALRDQESCRQSELAAGESPYEFSGMSFLGGIVMCMNRLGYKYKGQN